MSKLVLQQGETAHWHALILEAEHHAHINLCEDVESYLVFLLMRFAEDPTLSEQVVAIDFLQSHQCPRIRQQVMLRDVGDKCLIFAGLFPGCVDRRQVKVSYFIDMGQSAYGILAEKHQRLERALYHTLSHSFVQLTDVLGAAREIQQHDHITLPEQDMSKKYH